MIKRTKGNTQSVIVPLYTHTMHEDGTISTEAYTPTANDVVTASLVGKRIYNYPTTIGDGCIYFSITGVEVADIYSLRVIVIKADGSRLRYYTEEAIELTEETTEDTEQGAEFTTSGVTLDASWFFFAQGEQGEDGADGRGITNIVLMASQGLNDLYQINYTDGTHSTFVVKNGKDGVDGSNGEDGTDGRGITSVVKTSTAGLVDTYTITYTDSTTSTFNVTNGADGTTPDLSQYAKKVDATQNLVANSLTADLVTLGEGEINLATDSQDRLIYGGAVVLNEGNIVKAEGEADNLVYSMGMVDSMLPSVVQSTGQSTTNVMSQKAVTDALAGAGGGGWELLAEDTLTQAATSISMSFAAHKEIFVLLWHPVNSANTGNKTLKIAINGQSFSSTGANIVGAMNGLRYNINVLYQYSFEVLDNINVLFSTGWAETLANQHTNKFWYNAISQTIAKSQHLFSGSGISALQISAENYGWTFGAGTNIKIYGK